MLFLIFKKINYYQKVLNVLKQSPTDLVGCDAIAKSQSANWLTEKVWRACDIWCSDSLLVP